MRINSFSAPLLLILVLVVATTAAPVRAQVWPELAASEPADAGVMVVGGVLGGALGMLVGAAVGSQLERTLDSSCYDWCGLGGGLIGGALGESLGLALGVNSVNRGRGSFGASAVASLAIAGAGVLVAGMSGDDAVAIPILFSIPVAQLLAVVAIERHTTRPQEID